MSRVGRLLRGTGMIAIAGLVLTACSDPGFNQDAATKVLQSVDVNLDSEGSITDVAGSAVYLDELSGESDSSEDSFAVEDVVDDLPVRVSTQYETEDSSGSDLQELEGHTGRVEIDVTVENLTLDSSELTYDVAGESRETPALVGTPLSVASSVEMEGLRASDVVLDSESDAATNGVVSQSSEGDAIVQWGTVLAPPQSEATTTFQLVADVEDFSAPEFDIAVQAGFHTDMSFEGMVSAAFDTSGTSEYGMQQNAIELVAEVNDVLTRAGTTITDIRTTLDHTTETLGVDAAEQLQQNSDDMVAEMERVGEQLTAMESQVEGSMTGAESAMNAQLSQIVSSMNGMMGNTEASPPQLKEGEGCAATVENPGSIDSLYSTFLVLGAQLDGYAQGNAECRDEVVSEIQNTLGPEEPTQELCSPASADEDGSTTQEASITCTLFNAQVSVQESLNDLVENGKQNVQDLVEQKVTDGAMGYSDAIDSKLEAIRGQLDQVEDREDKWKAVDEALEEMEGVRGDFEAFHEYGEGQLEELKDHTESIQGQQSDIAENLCGLIDDGAPPDEVDQEKISEINKAAEELVGTPCVAEPGEDPSEDPTDEPSGEPSEDPTGGPTDAPTEPTDEPTEPSGEPTAPTDSPTASEPEETPTDEEESEPAGPTSEEPEDPAAVQPISHTVEEPDEHSLNAQMEQHLADETEAWESVLDDVGYLDDEGFSNFETALADIQETVDAARSGVDDEAESVDTVLDEIKTILGNADNDNDEDLVSLHQKLESSLTELETDLVDQTNQEFDEFEDETSEHMPENVDEQVRVVTDRVNGARDSVVESYNSTIAGLATTSDAVINDTGGQLAEQQSTLESQQDETSTALNESTTAVLEGIHQTSATSTRDLEGASAQLGSSLSNVILDLGDPEVQGSGILGSMSASSAMSDTADYQLALASQRAAGFANVRSEDIAEIMLRQAQFSASLEEASGLPAFHLDVPSGASSQTIYAFHVGGDSE